MADDGFNLDEWLDDFQPLVVEAKVVQKASLVAEHTRLQLAWVEARRDASDVMHDAETAAIATQVAAVEAEIEASEKTFSFQGIGHGVWQDIKRKYPPGKSDKEHGLDVDILAWAPAVIAACSRDPKITLPQAQTMLRKLPPGEFDKLLVAVREANLEVAGAPKSVLTARIARSRRNGDSPITERPSESPDVDYSGTLADQEPES